MPLGASPVSDPFLDDGERERSDPRRGETGFYRRCMACNRSPLVHIDQNGGCSNNLELVEDHTDSLVAVEAVRVVLHQFEPVRPYFQVVSAQSDAWKYPRRLYPRRLSISGSSTYRMLEDR